MVNKWKIVGEELGPNLPIFKIILQSVINPRSGAVHKHLRMESLDWVNIIAITKNQKIVVIWQYRTGIQKISMEIPGGSVDEGEHHSVAAMRELAEETGYTSNRWTYLGSVEVNPATQNNLCHHYLAEDVEKTSDPEFDDGEDITVALYELGDIFNAIRSGEFAHSLALSALARVFDLRSAFLPTKS